MEHAQQTATSQAASLMMGGTTGEDSRKRPLIVRDEQGFWSVLDVDKDGNQRTKGNLGHMEPVAAMDEGEAVLFFVGIAKDAPNKRRAAISLLALILREQIERVRPWQGAGDPKKGLDNELKGAFQKCEDKFFEKFLEKNHPAHKQFMRGLPAGDLQGRPLEINGKLVPEKQYEAFLTATRKDSTYSANKNLVLSYFSLVGRLPFDDDENIIPPEIMAQMVNNARIIVPTDNSYRKRLSDLRVELIAEKQAPPDDDMPEIVAILRDMLKAAEDMEKVAAVRRTNRPQAGQRVNVAKDADAAIAAAQASTGRVEPEKEPKPAPEVTH